MKLLRIFAGLALVIGLFTFTSSAAATAPCGGGTRVVVYENANYGGSWKYFCKPTNVPDLGNVGHSGYCYAQEIPYTGTWADCISSYKAYGTGGYLCFFTGASYTGFKQGYQVGAFVPQVQWNDKILSIRWQTNPC